MVKRIAYSIFFFLVMHKLHAQVRLPKLISNGMVLQRDTKLKIWGWASPGEKVALMFSSDKSKAYTTAANEKGEWHIMLASQKAGGPYYMKIEASNHLVIENILVGDVWLCSGQSNMEQGMGVRLKYKYAEEIATANNPGIRHFLVPDKYNFMEPQTDVESGAWKEANPQNIAEFTAVGYFFAKELYEKYKVPVGLINAALGGSPAEAWISEPSLKAFPKYYDEMQSWKKDPGEIDQLENNARTMINAWNKVLTDTDEGQRGNWKDPLLNDTDWQQFSVPGYWRNTIPGFKNGVIWLRKEIIVPSSMVGKGAKLELGRITDTDSVYINGRFVGNTTYQYPARRYELKPNLLKEGKNIIVVRVVTSSGNGGFAAGKRYELTTASDTIGLTGDWKYKVGSMATSLYPATVTIRNQPGGLHNAMIAPLTNYPIKGAIWYQGETNSNYPDNYRSVMKTLIEDWRSLWKNDFPFIYVQLPNYMEAKETPQLNSNWATLRWEQFKTLSVPHTGMVTAIDLGEWNDLHPENKKDISYRLSLLARNMAYGEKKLVASGPLYQSMKSKGNKIIITFRSAGSGLISKDNEALRHFAIAGSDGRYVKANAVIKKNTIEVWSDEVDNPVSVYYAWADNPDRVNLYNKEGLPASPFKTE